MKKILLLSILVLFASSNTVLAKNMEDRITAATAYEKTVPVKGMVHDMLEQMKLNPQTKLTDEDIEVMKEILDVDEMRTKMIDGMAKHFTVGELNALNEFYSKPEGKSVMKKMPAYMADFMPYIQQKMIEGFIAGQQQKMKESEHDHTHAPDAATGE